MLQRYRSDRAETQADGAIRWYADWIGGPSLAKIENCRLHKLEGDMRRTVYVTGGPDTYFSTPAVCKLGGKIVRGYIKITEDENGAYNLVFRHTYY